MGDYISWLAVYPFLKSFFLSRVTPLFPAIFFFQASLILYVIDDYLYDVCARKTFATFCGPRPLKRSFCLLAEEFPFIFLAD